MRPIDDNTRKIVISWPQFGPFSAWALWRRTFRPIGPKTSPFDVFAARHVSQSPFPDRLRSHSPIRSAFSAILQLLWLPCPPDIIVYNLFSDIYYSNKPTFRLRCSRRFFGSLLNAGKSSISPSLIMLVKVSRNLSSSSWVAHKTESIILVMLPLNFR